MKIFRYISILLILFSLTSCGNKGKDICKFSTPLFCDENCIPVVTINLNGEDVNFIVDTGSEICVIDENYFKERYNAFRIIDSTEVNIKTVNREQRRCKTYIIKGVVNDSIDMTLYSMDITDIINDTFIKQQVFIEGIIGVDFLYENNLVIDFKNKTLNNL